MDNNILNRKGATRLSDIPEDVLALLNRGEIASVNLMEWLATDQLILARKVLTDLSIAKLIKPLEEKLATEKKPTTKKTSEIIAHTVLENITDTSERDHLTQQLFTHPSDSVRCWAAYIVGFDAAYPIEEKLLRIFPYAADEHFGVREIAWIAVRNDIIKHLSKSLSILEQWALDEDENIRRFASESTRPRGVWCAHIKTLRTQPELAEPLLEPLKFDAAKYVRDSVGNWLNDASKDSPVWVKSLCERWQSESTSKETAYIVKKALRTLAKN
jgi:3-methyladenine DNA glycosylase AlkC